MLILLRTSSSDTYQDANYNFAVVKIEEFEARKLSRLFKSFDADRATEPGLLQMVFESIDLECEFYDDIAWGGDEELSTEERVGPLLANVVQEMEERGFAVIPDDLSLPFTPRDAHLPASLFLQIDMSEFWWVAHPQSYDIVVTTAPLPRNLLSQIM